MAYEKRRGGGEKRQGGMKISPAEKRLSKKA
jgi:hypothetical protein